MNDIEIKYGSIEYKDTLDHFENGVLRLLNIDRNLFEKWMKCANEYEGSLFDKLAMGFTHIRPPITTPTKISIERGPYGEEGNLWHRLSDNYYVIRSDNHEIAWLGKIIGLSHIVREISPPEYEEEYFEGDPQNDGGYGKYTEQSSWRLDKAERQLNEIMEITKLQSGTVLDVGSSYGYFRKALDKKGFAHDGIEISEYACKITKMIYGYETYQGTLTKHAPNLISKYDLITLWDVIEHVANPKALLNEVYQCLKPGGVLVIKTPNLDALEVQILGEYNYSFKREHLVYFTAEYLNKIALSSGFKNIHMTSNSHFLKGFIGEKDTKKLADECRGSDLIAYFRKE
jgi:2-polyprenyl-3-methyl-5-hydroxy-6-metoxy-1,4-benzoquinol methylase